MKFVLTEADEFWWPVSVKSPDPDKAGAFVESTFEARFKPMTRSAANALSQADTIDGHVIAFRGVVDEHGAEVKTSPEALARLLDLPWVRRGLFMALVEASTGTGAQKN